MGNRRELWGNGREQMRDVVRRKKRRERKRGGERRYLPQQR